MLFSSATFLYAFLPLTLLGYFLVPARFRNAVLLLASLLFYAFGEPVYVLLLLFSAVSGWGFGLYMEKHRGEKAAKTALIASVVVNLGLLGFFKYADFAVATVNALLGLSLPLPGVPLPIGISFFTFQTLSYTVDVYRGRVRAQSRLTTLATFLCLFPQLIAGPIVRYSDVESELRERHTTLSETALGVRRFAVGLGKKVLLANAMGELTAAFLATKEQSVLFAWLYAVAYTLQIYFDFSGYSDMAIGLGHLFGFTFPENFNYPYLSRSITEFWRRWHMTLGGWFRDYVYIPLGGNRVKTWKWLRNIAAVWLLTGLWHGAAWNFVLWGGFFGLLLMTEKLFLGKLLERLPRFVGHLYVLLAVVVSFVIFNAESLSAAFSVLGAMFGAGGLPLVGAEALYVARSYAVLLLIAAVGATDLPARMARRLNACPALWWGEGALSAALLLLATASIVSGSYNPFLYFRF